MFMRKLTVRRVRFIFAGLLVAGALAGPIAAAEPPAFDTKALLDRRMDTFKDRLDLTDAQESKVRGIQEEHLKRMGELLTDAREKVRPRARLRALREMQTLRRETADRMKAVLSAPQMETYTAMMDAQEEAMRARLAERRKAQDEK